MVEAVIVTEEECKEVPSCTWRATDPTTHSHIDPQLSAGMDRKLAMLKPFLPVYGTSTSYSVRDGLLPVHPHVLCLPATLRASTLTMKTRYNELAMRPSTDVSLLLTTPAASPSSRPSRASSYRTALRDRTAAMARSRTPVTERARHEARQEGNLNPRVGEGTWGTVMGPEQVWGPGLGSLLTMLPWFPRHPNLACTNEATPRGESPEATRPDTKGHTARHRRPHGRDSEDTLTHPLADPQRSECDHRPAEARR